MSANPSMNRGSTKTGFHGPFFLFACHCLDHPQIMARSDVQERGATPQELAINPDTFVTELARRNINIKIY